MKNKILLLCLACVLVFSCKKDTFSPASAEYFIFGNYACYCIGQCAQLYKYTTSSMLIGTGPHCQMDEFTYEGTTLPAEDIALGAALLDAFPEDLYNSEETRFGCPDCGDQGGYYISIKNDGEIKTWTIDVGTDDLPGFLLPFQQKIKETLNALQ